MIRLEIFLVGRDRSLIIHIDQAQFEEFVKGYHSWIETKQTPSTIFLRSEYNHLLIRFEAIQAIEASSEDAKLKALLNANFAR